jgi:hypothetical protein
MAFIYDLSDTWNNAGISFNGIKLNATDTASAAGSKLIDLQINGASKFTVGKTGNVIATGLIESTVGGFRFPDGTTQTTKATVNSVSGTGTVNGITLTGTVTDSGSLTLGGTLGNIANSQLTNSAITINGTSTALGGSISVGTVTSVAALTLGTSGTDLASSVANGTTTPVITLNVPTASAANRGALSPSDWSTFNAKQAALVSGTNIKTVGGASLLGSGDVGTIGLAYGGTGATTESGARTALGLGTAAVLNAGVAGGVATLDGSGTVPTSQLPGAVLGGLNYQGTWNASTNVPTLASSTGSKGYYYVVSTAGSTNLNGITDWKIGDWAVYDGTAWQKVDNTDAVSSVNGYTGAVVLSTSDVAQGTNLYFTQAAARASVSAGTGISYNSTTGVITNSAPDQTVALTGAGTTTVTGTYPNFTITSNDSTVGTVTSVAASGGTTGLTFTGSPITTAGTLTLGGTLAVANGGTGATTLTSGYVLKGNGTSAVSASVLYDNGTNIGIGTTSPSALFHISQNGGGDIGALVSQTNGGNGTTARYRATHGSGAAFNLQAGNGQVDLNVTSNHHLTFGTNDTERFRIGASGQFGIGGATYGSAGQVLTSGGASAAPTWTTPTTGTVTSVGGTGTVNGITLTGTVTSSGSLTLGGTLSGVDLASQVTGTLPVANGGTGTATAFTAGSVVFAGASGVYSQDNANLFWDNTNDRLGIGTASPASLLHLGTSNPEIRFDDNDATGVVQLRQSASAFLIAVDPTGVDASSNFQVAIDGSERLRITSAGNVGIGTGSPSAKLHVSDAANGKILISGTSTSAELELSAPIPKITFTDTSGSAADGEIKVDGNAMQIAMGGSERMRIDAIGNVGIGTTSPISKLQVSAGLASVGLTWGAASTSSGLLTVGANGYLGSAWFNTPAGNSTYACGLGIDGSFSEPIATVNIKAFGPNATGGYGSNLCLYTTNETSSIERMRIDRLGNVGIGTASPSSLGGNITTLDVSGASGGAVRFQRTATTATSAYVAAISGEFRVASADTNPLTLLTNNTERMRITSAGNVGIGIATPTAKLHVYDSSSSITPLIVDSGSGIDTTRGIAMNVEGSNYGRILVPSGSGGAMAFWTGSANAATERMRINTSGNVGINQPPNASQGRVQINQPLGSSIDGALRLTDNATTSFVFNNISSGLSALWSSGAVALGTGSNTFTERMRISSSGNVGIGTSTPNYPTHIYTANNGYGLQVGSNAGGAAAGNYTGILMSPSNASSNDPYYSGAIRVQTTAAAPAFQEPVMTFLVQNPSTYQLADVTEKMRITGSGNVGIGTNSPSYKLQVQNAGNLSTLIRNGNAGTGLYSELLLETGNTFSNISQAAVRAVSTNGGNADIALTFGTSTGTGSTATERMRIDAGGNMGIGLVNPGSYGRLVVGDPADTTNNIISMLTRYATVAIVADATTAANGALIDVSWANGGQGPLRFGFAGTERMRLQSSGNLVIGSTTVGSNRLGVVGSASDSMFRFQTGAVATNYGSFGTTAGATYGYLGGGGGGALSGGTESDFVVRAESNLLLAIGNTEVMRVDNSGRIGIGTTTPGTKLDVLVGNSVAAAFTSDSFASSPTLIVWNKDATSGRLIGFRSTSSFTTVGTIETNGSITIYGTTSDVRLKKNIADADDASNLIDALQVRKFDWKSDSSHQRYGFVAQELLEVAPEAVTNIIDPEDMMGVDYSKLVPMLVKEIQSMRLRLAQLEGN